MWELDCEESLAPKNWCFWTVVLEKTLESPLDCKEIQPVHPKGDQSWVWSVQVMLKLKLQSLGHLMRRVDSLEKTLMLGGLGAGGEGDDRGWDGWTASLTRWTWVWVNSGSWWWTGRPGMLRFMGWQRVGHNWATELNWTDCNMRTKKYTNYKCTAYCSFITWTYPHQYRPLPGIQRLSSYLLSDPPMCDTAMSRSDYSGPQQQKQSHRQWCPKEVPGRREMAASFHLSKTQNQMN